MSCQIKRKYDGTIKGVYAPNGNESILYSDIVDNVSVEDMSSDPYVQSIMDKGLIADASVKELALALWSKAYTPEFIESFGDWKEDKLPNTDVNGEPLYSQLLNNVLAIENVKSGIKEFATSIAKNKDVIDSFKRKMEGIDFVFSQSPELASIGSKIQYLQYLSTIFKTSKVKDIVYHGSKSDKKFDKFVKGLYREVTLPGNITKTVPESSRVGIWFSDKNYASDPANTPTGVVIPAILNIKNPAYADDISYGPIKKYQDTNDAVIGKDDVNKETDSIAVFDPEQIHILSSKADIQGFKDFMAFENSEFSKYGTYQQFRDFITNKSSMEIENKLIETGKIDRVC